MTDEFNGRTSEPSGVTRQFVTCVATARGRTGCPSLAKGIVIAGLAKIGMVHGAGSWTAENVEKGIQDLLICVEMLLIAVAHTSAFPTAPYEDGATLRDGASLLEAHFAHHSAIRDFNEVKFVIDPFAALLTSEWDELPCKADETWSPMKH